MDNEFQSMDSTSYLSLLILLDICCVPLNAIRHAGNRRALRTRGSPAAEPSDGLWLCLYSFVTSCNVNCSSSVMCSCQGLSDRFIYTHKHKHTFHITNEAVCMSMGWGSSLYILCKYLFVIKNKMNLFAVGHGFLSEKVMKKCIVNASCEEGFKHTVIKITSLIQPVTCHFFVIIVKFTSNF